MKEINGYYVVEKLTLLAFMSDIAFCKRYKAIYYEKKSAIMNIMLKFLNNRYTIKKVNYSSAGEYNSIIYGSLQAELIDKMFDDLFLKREIRDLSAQIRSSSDAVTEIILKKTLQPFFSQFSILINFIFSLSCGDRVLVNSRSICFVLPSMNAVSEGKNILYRKKLFPYLYPLLPQLSATLKSFFRLCAKKNKSAGPELPFFPGDERFETVFFPHKGLYYSDLYKKTDFYCESFPQESTLHVETSAYDQALALQYEKENIPFQFWNLTPSSKNIMKNALINFPNGLIQSRRNIIFRALVKSILISKIKRIEECLLEHPFIKLACVEFDILFDPTIAFVLKNKRIKTLSRQSRPVCAYLPDFSSMIFDRYVVINQKIKTVLMASPRVAIDEIEVSPYRVNVFSNEQELEDFKEKYISMLGLPKGFCGFILCLDYHTSPEDKDTAHPVAVVKNNRIFYQDIIELAKKNADKYFIIRGKNADWCRLDHFADIYHMILSLPNVHIDSQYSVFRHTEKLLFISKVVIGKYTTVLEMAQSFAIPYLIHDYGENYKSLFSNLLAHHDPMCFCHSQQELMKKFDLLLNETMDNRSHYFRMGPSPIKEYIVRELG